MKRIFLIIITFVTIGVSSYAAIEPESLLKQAKKEAKFLHSSKKIQPRKKSDDKKYICLESAGGKQFVDRSKIALDLFEKAANAGSGEAAYTLFCYYCLGKYDSQTLFPMDWNFYQGNQLDKMLWEHNFNRGMTFLQQAVDLSYPAAMEFYILKNDSGHTDNKLISDDFTLLYDAISGDPVKQLQMALRYKSSNTVKYEYWIRQSINQHDWPLMARTDYANYLLDTDRRDKALAVLKPADKKQDYRNDNTAGLAMNDWLMFYVADCLYAGNVSDAIRNCDNLYNNISPYDDFVRFHNNHDINYLEYCINYFTSKQRNRLFLSVYDLNRNPTDSLIIHKRGESYEVWGDSIEAFNYFKTAALKGNIPSIIKTFDYAAKGHELSDEEVAEFLPRIIIGENKESGDFTVSGNFTNWKIYFILGEFFYNSPYRDYGKAIDYITHALKTLHVRLRSEVHAPSNFSNATNSDAEQRLITKKQKNGSI